MSATRSGDVPSRAVDAAMALLSDDPTPTPAAPQAEEQQAPQQQPERQGPARGPGGRFAPRGDQPTPQAAPETQPQQQPGQLPPAQPQTQQIDWQAIALQERQEKERLRGSYGANLGQKDAEIERWRKEAADKAAEAEKVRQDTIANYRASVEAMPEDTPEELVQKARAERALLAIERQGFEETRTQTQKQRQEAEEQTSRTQAQREDLAQRAAHWGVLEGYAALAGRALGLEDAEIVEVVEGLKTPEMAAVLRAAPLADLRAVVQERGGRLQQILQQRAQARLTANRQQAIASGAHEREGTGQQPAAERPYERFTRERVRRPGLANTANMVLALFEDDE